MSNLDPTTLVLQLDLNTAAAMFWFVLLFDLPRYTLSGIAVVMQDLGRRRFRGCGNMVPSSGEAAPLVSVILVGHNERRSIRRCVRSLREQTHRPLEILCVDDGSTDGTAAELRHLRDEGLIDVMLSTSLRGGKSSAGNLGVSQARGTIIVVTDCDCTFDRDAIHYLIAPFADAGTGATTGNIGARNAVSSVLSAMQGLEYLLSISVGKRFLDMFGQVTCASGALSAYRRAALLQVGGLDVGPGEDLDLTLRLRDAGWRIRFADQAWCLTDVPQGMRHFIRQRMRWERDALRLRLRKHRKHLDPRYPEADGHEILHQLEFLLTHVVLTLAFPIYIGWLIDIFGTTAVTVLVIVTLTYTVLDTIAVSCAVMIADPPARPLRLWLYVIAYGCFHGYLMRAIRLVALVQEWVFDWSYRDTYVPRRVAGKAPRY